MSAKVGQGTGGSARTTAGEGTGCGPQRPLEEGPRSRPEHYLPFIFKVHIQTIGILVSEKADLQSALAHTQQAARQKAGEAECPSIL